MEGCFLGGGAPTKGRVGIILLVIARRLLAQRSLICYNTSDMIQVTRKDPKEANENIIRRFNRKVLQSGVLANAKASMRFSKDISKTERRSKAIIRKERKNDKLAKARLGIR